MDTMCGICRQSTHLIGESTLLNGTCSLGRRGIRLQITTRKMAKSDCQNRHLRHLGIITGRSYRVCIATTLGSRSNTQMPQS
jgi:hypothetical protein